MFFFDIKRVEHTTLKDGSDDKSICLIQLSNIDKNSEEKAEIQAARQIALGPSIFKFGEFSLDFLRVVGCNNIDQEVMSGRSF
mmetsp:Transcript_47912/g.55205  ORF Transcript_47912/g.55205 Transcript_47912/m.55205 type:complete len:83 (+) Transcript_47912:32-280(+)